MTLMLLSLAGCATNPVSGNKDFVMLSEKQELALGEQAAAEIAKEMIILPKSDPLAQYVDRIGQRLAVVSDRKNLFYRFHVVDDSTINAFALPGGYIYIYRGLLAHMNNEAELAAVLGHEIGHVTARHSVQQYSKAQAYQLGVAITSIFVPIPQGSTMLTDMLAMAVIQGYGRDAELQSDELSLEYLSRAGYNAKATIGVLETLKRLDELDTKEKKDAGEKVEKYHGAFSSHPETRKRIDEAVTKFSDMQKGQGIVNHQQMLKAIEGYAYGDSAEQGAVVGRRFLHPELGIQLKFPDEWVITNTPTALNARLRQQNVFFQLQMKELQKRESAREILEGLFPKRHTTFIGSGSQAGMSYAHAQVRMSAPKVSQAMIDAYIFLKGSQAFMMLLWSERDKFEQYRPEFAKIAKSFRRYDKEKDGDIPRIALHTWQAGDSWQGLAQKSRQILGRFTAEKLAALNGMGLDEKPQPGEIIKTVR